MNSQKDVLKVGQNLKKHYQLIESKEQGRIFFEENLEKADDIKSMKDIAKRLIDKRRELELKTFDPNRIQKEYGEKVKNLENEASVINDELETINLKINNNNSAIIRKNKIKKEDEDVRNKGGSAYTTDQSNINRRISRIEDEVTEHNKIIMELDQSKQQYENKLNEIKISIKKNEKIYNEKINSNDRESIKTTYFINLINAALIHLFNLENIDLSFNNNNELVTKKLSEKQDILSPLMNSSLATLDSVENVEILFNFKSYNVEIHSLINEALQFNDTEIKEFAKKIIIASIEKEVGNVNINTTNDSSESNQNHFNNIIENNKIENNNVNKKNVIGTQSNVLTLSLNHDKIKKLNLYVDKYKQVHMPKVGFFEKLSKIMSSNEFSPSEFSSEDSLGLKLRHKLIKRLIPALQKHYDRRNELKYKYKYYAVAACLLYLLGIENKTSLSNNIKYLINNHKDSDFNTDQTFQDIKDTRELSHKADKAVGCFDIDLDIKNDEEICQKFNNN